MRLPLKELRSLITISLDDVLKDAFTINLNFATYPEFSHDPSHRILCVSTSRIGTSATSNPLLAFTCRIWFSACNSVQDEGSGADQETVVDGIRLEDIFVDPADPAGSLPVNIMEDAEADELFARAVDMAESSNVANNFILHTQSSVQRPQVTISQASVIPSWDDEIPPTPKSLDVPISNYLDELWA